MQSPNFIKSVTIPGTIRSEPVQFAYPTLDHNHNVINILCGQNNSGKSFVLEGIRQCLQLRWAHVSEKTSHTTHTFVQMDTQNGLHKGDLYVTMSAGEPQPNALFFGNSWRDMSKAGTIGLTSNPNKPPTNRIPYTALFSRFAYQQIQTYLPDDQMVSAEEWLNSRDMRQRILKNIKTNDILYKCMAGKELIDVLEKVLGGHLYFRYVRTGEDTLGQIEFSLLYGDGAHRVYSQWSDGQRAVFYFLTLVNEVSPDILLLDEIENHLHPTFITEVLTFVKTRVPQSIITTHHPHVIFSELVDRVIYLETSRPSLRAAPPQETDYAKSCHQSAPTRQIFTLETSFEKLSAAYKLFAHQDKQLLHQAQRVLNDTEIMFYSILLDIFSNRIENATQRLNPDSQSRQLLLALKNLGILSSSRPSPVILDFGAGYGRTQKELAKLSIWQLNSSIKWICWEYEPTTRRRLKDTIASMPFDAWVPNSLDEVEESSVDACVFVNVIHHLTPSTLAASIHSAISKLLPAGALIFLELYPLISAEKFAVPYSAEQLTTIFRKLGMVASHEIIPVRDTVAYCLMANKPFKAEPDWHITQDQIRQVIEQEWDTILQDALHKYVQRQAATDYQGYRDITQSLTTIASILAWRRELWK